MAGQKNHDYHILHPSVWPFVGALGAFVMLFGAVLFFHDCQCGREKLAGQSRPGCLQVVR